MKREKLQKSMGLIEDEFIEEAAPYNAKPMTSLARASINIKRLAILAACVAILAGTVIGAIIYNIGKNPIEDEQITPADESEDFPPIPIYDDAQYSAEDIARLIYSRGIEMGTATTAYKKVYVSKDEDLYIDPLPEEEYLTVYKRKEEQKELDKEEFSKFTDDILTRLYERRNMPKPTYEIMEQNDHSNSENKRLVASVNRSDKDLKLLPLFSQRPHINSASFSFNSSPESGHFLIGEAKASMFVSTISDEQIKADLAILQKELFYIFDVEFKDVTVSRYYIQDREYPYSITVTFYNSTNEADHSSDNISVTFSNRNSKTSLVLPKVVISYNQYRDSMSVPVKKVKKISLSEAEELLYKGYVFGGHSCPLCMSSQTPVDFEGYDYVKIVYISGYNEYTESIPFYAFYKYIGNTRSGNKIFAMTYVAAIEVSGYEEYFEAQEKNHVDISESTEDE